MSTTTITWIATAQQLPDDDTTVLIAWRDGDVSVGWHDGDAGWRGIDSMPCEAPAHWADLPEAPR